MSTGHDTPAPQDHIISLLVRRYSPLEHRYIPKLPSTRSRCDSVRCWFPGRTPNLPSGLLRHVLLLGTAHQQLSRTRLTYTPYREMSDENPSATAPVLSMITDAAEIKEYNRGPITSYWEAPASCASTMSFDGNMYYGFGDKGIIDTSCYPMGTMRSQEIVDKTAWGLYYYSPAVCPGGWDTVTKYTSGIPHENSLTTLSVGKETTAVLCCPE